MIYWSRRSDSSVHSYCGLLFVRRCTAVDLVEHYEEFVKQLDIDSKFLLHFGMDRPNINLSFEGKLTQKFSEVDTSFLRLGSCSFHAVHSAFQKGIKQLFQGTGSISNIKQRRKGLLIWMTFSLIFIPFLNFLVLDLRITLA